MAQPQLVTELLKTLKAKYQVVLDDAVLFYEQYESLYGVYAKESQRVIEIKHQLSTIHGYKKKHGSFPKIKGQDSTDAYIKELEKIKQRAQSEIDHVEPDVLEGFEKRQALLTDIANSIAKMMISERDASQFIATMMLRAPLPADSSRCPTNEKNKPIYIAALAISLLKQLTSQQLIEEDYISQRVPPLVPSESHPEQLEYPQEMLSDYINEVLNPIIIAVLIHNIGSYSVEAERIYKGNRYRMLDEEARKSLINIIHSATNDYLHYGFGKPQQEKMDETQFELEMGKFELTQNIVNDYPKSQSPIGNLLRIPMIYSSFMLSTKPQHDFKLSFKAYDILKSGIDKNVVYAPYGEVFLNMVGQYPLGCGIFFISKETGLPERAVVSSLNPPKPTSAIVKQLTRRQVKFDDHTQVAASEEYIVSNDIARKKSDFAAPYYKKQFPTGFYWNPAEPWERDIDHQKFWRRDNQIKSN